MEYPIECKYPIQCNSETLICDACGEESLTDHWKLVVDTPHPIVAESIIILKCPNCLKSNVYEFAYHSHIELEEKRE